MPRDLELEHGKLRGDVEVVRRYGDAHPDAWVGLRFENEPPVRIVALFAGSALDVHREALRSLVSFPDQLEVRSSPWPLVRLEEIRAEIHDMATSSPSGQFEGWGGTGDGKVSVRLRADAAHVAAQLLERYGEAVDLTVGFLRFPQRVYPEGQAPHFADAGRAAPPLLPGELRVTTDDDLVVRSGENLRSTVRLINEGSAEVVVRTNGQLTALVADPVTHEVVGGYSGAQAAPLVRFSASPGGSVEIPLLIGTASTAPRLGYAVPPGRWAARITLGLGERGVFGAPLLPLSVVA